MCFNELEGRSLLPDCHIADRVFLYSLLHSMQEQDRRPEDVDAELRDRYNVFREMLPNYPVPEVRIAGIPSYIEGHQEEPDTVWVCANPDCERTSDSSLDSDSDEDRSSANRID
ncbi:uncharacterized protein LOC119547845 [Drosophila subpulchrella]|uniref:uncharacterized protein LOC119547845 n=1 Tax=Drosophila subpulchrella TaxID=1486046 RepID=UPI0018A1791D|nr:uncharacterized protein LOC119547845 [Drosophila subpulchrella]